MAYQLTDEDRRIAQQMAMQRLGQIRPQPQQAPQKQKNFLQDNISTGGSLAGALAGGAAGTAILPGVGTLIGALLGGAAGGGVGQVAENSYMGDDLGKDVLSETLWGGATALPFGSVARLGKAGGILAKGLGNDAARLAARDLVNEAGVKAMSPGALKKYIANNYIPEQTQTVLNKAAFGSNILNLTGKEKSLAQKSLGDALAEKSALGSNALGIFAKDQAIANNIAREGIISSAEKATAKAAEARRFNELALENVKNLAKERAGEGLPLANGGGILSRPGKAPSFITEGVNYMDIPAIPTIPAASPYSLGGLKNVRGAVGDIATVPTSKLSSIYSNEVIPAVTTPLTRAAERLGSAPAMGQKAAGKLSGAADDLAIKQFRLNPGQISNFKKLHKEDPGALIRRYGISSVEDVGTKGIEPLQNAFDDVVQIIPSVSAKDIEKGLKSVYQPLLRSPVLSNQQFGQSVKNQADELLKVAKSGKLPASTINDLRRSFDSAVRYTQKGAPEYNVNKETADALRSVLQKVADSAGIKSSQGKTFKEIGLELSKLYSLDDIVSKQSELGRGSLPLGLTTLLGAGVGGTVGLGSENPTLGSLGGVAAIAALNSSAGRRALMKTISGASEKAAGTSGRQIGQSVGATAARIGGAGALRGLPNPQESLPENSMPAMTAAATTTNPAINANMPQSYTTGQQMSSPNSLEQALIGGSQIQSPYGKENLLYDIQRDPANAQEYIQYYQMLQEVFAPQNNSLNLNSTAAGVVADTKTGLNALASLGDSITSSGANAPLLGQLRARNPFDTEAQNLQAQVATAKQIVGKALEGGVLRKEDEIKYAKLLPTMGDTDEVARFKIGELQRLIQMRLDEYLGSMGQGQPGSPAGGSTLEDILMSQAGVGGF